MSQVSYRVTFGGAPVILVDPEEHSNFGRANSYFCPVGVRAGRGAVLMMHDDLDAIKDNATHQFIIQPFKVMPGGEPANDPFGAEFADKFGEGGGLHPDGDTLSFGPMYITNNRRLSKSSGNVNSVYLVEFADRRILAERFTDSETQQYNLHSYAHDELTAKWLDGTSSTPSVPFTWQQILTTLWPDLMGVVPVLPGTAPTSRPNDLSWYGVNHWLEAIPAIMDRLGLVLKYNPLANIFDFEDMGTGQTDIPTDLPIPIYKSDVVDAMHVDSPDKIGVYNYDWEANYGTERDTGLGDITLPGSFRNQWLLGPPYDRTQVDHTSYALVDPNRVIPDTKLAVWSDARREYDNDDNEITANTIASRDEVTTGIYADSTVERVHKIHAGVFKILPGARVKAVTWYNTGGGTFTEHVEHPGLPVRPKAIGCELPSEPFMSPDLSRTDFPSYPRTDQLVKITISAPLNDPGEDELPLPSNVFEGRVCVIHSGTVSVYEQCYIRLVDGDASGNVLAVDGDFFIGRLMGNFSSSGLGVRPLYAARKGTGGGGGGAPFVDPSAIVRVLSGEASPEIGDAIPAPVECAYQGKVLKVIGSEVVGDWDYKTPATIGPPSSGEIEHPDDKLDTLHVSKEDTTSPIPIDYGAELLRMKPGSTIVGAGKTWTVKSVTDNATYVTFTVDPAEQGTPGLGQFTFSIPFDLCDDPYETVMDCWIAKASSHSGSLFHHDELMGLKVLASFQPTGQEVNSTWDYVTPSTSAGPATGKIEHANDGPGFLRVHKTDSNGTPWGAELAAIAVGLEIVGAGQTWTITSVTDSNGWVTFGVLPTTQGTPGEGQFRIGVAEAKALYIVQPSGAGAAGMYKATVDTAGDFGGDAPSFSATIQSVVQPGTKKSGDPVTVRNDYNVAAVAGAECLLVEHATGGTPDFLALEVERTVRTVLQSGHSIDAGTLKFPVETSWGHFEANSATEDIAFDSTKVLRSNGDTPSTFTEVTIWHLDTGLDATVFGVVQQVVSSVTWSGTQIDIERKDVTVFKTADGSPQIISTDDCPP